MAFLRCDIDYQGELTPGQLVLALVELAAAYALLAFPLLLKHVRNGWLIAAAGLVAILGLIYVFGRLYKHFETRYSDASSPN